MATGDGVFGRGGKWHRPRIATRCTQASGASPRCWPRSPSTEQTTGFDLVKAQLHVASGGRLEGERPTEVGHGCNPTAHRSPLTALTRFRHPDPSTRLVVDRLAGALLACRWLPGDLTNLVAGLVDNAIARCSL